MAATNFDEGLQGILGGKYGQGAYDKVTDIRLFTAISSAMSKDTVKANFTEMTAIMAYVKKMIAAGDFAFALDTGNHWNIATGVYTWTFTAGAGVTILGWYGTNGANTKAVLGDTFASPVVIPAGGGFLQVTIADKYKDC